MALTQDTGTSTTQAPLRRSAFNPLDYVALALMVIGGLNWGLVGLFQFDLVAALLGPMTMPTRVVYVVVAVAALYGIALALRAPRH